MDKTAIKLIVHTRIKNVLTTFLNEFNSTRVI